MKPFHACSGAGGAFLPQTRRLFFSVTVGN